MAGAGIGSHLGVTHVDEGTLDWLVERFDVKSMLDVGCGPGGMVTLAREKEIKADGVDGDPAVCDDDIKGLFLWCHDFTQWSPSTSALWSGLVWDLGWCVELLEHVEEEFLPNIFDALAHCRYLLVTAAPPSQPGVGHVTMHEQDWWVQRFAQEGFWWMTSETKAVREVSTMERNLVRDRGMVFLNSKLLDKT